VDEQEKAIVRACLDQVVIGLTEAIEVRPWLETLGPGVRRQCQEFCCLAGRLRRSESLKAGGPQPAGHVCC
jgi:hypothetical protein